MNFLTVVLLILKSKNAAQNSPLPSWGPIRQPGITNCFLYTVFPMPSQPQNIPRTQNNIENKGVLK